jgi:hypothetical protein
MLSLQCLSESQKKEKKRQRSASKTLKSATLTSKGFFPKKRKKRRVYPRLEVIGIAKQKLSRKWIHSKLFWRRASETQTRVENKAKKSKYEKTILTKKKKKKAASIKSDSKTSVKKAASALRMNLMRILITASLVASSSESESEDEVTTNKLRKNSSDKSKKNSKSAPKPSLSQKLLVEVVNADEDDSDFKGGWTKVSRGVKQSKVAGETIAHQRERQRRVKVYIPKPGITKLGKHSTDPKHILAERSTWSRIWSKERKYFVLQSVQYWGFFKGGDDWMQEFARRPAGSHTFAMLPLDLLKFRPALGDIRKRRAVYRYTTLYCTLLHSTTVYCTLLHSTALYCTLLLNNTYTALRFLIAQGRPKFLPWLSTSSAHQLGGVRNDWSTCGSYADLSLGLRPVV